MAASSWLPFFLFFSSDTHTQYTFTFNKKELQQQLSDKGITLIGGGIDESPGAYKDINRVMQYQNELVNVLARFYPKVVRMAKS